MSQETALPIRPMKMVQLRQAVEVETAGSVSFRIRTHLWSPWGRIALANELVSRDARREAQQLQAGESIAPLLQQEADAAFTCVCASASHSRHCIGAFFSKSSTSSPGKTRRAGG